MSVAVYRNEQHAIIRAMAVDSIPSCKPAQWQKQYSSGYVEDLTKEVNMKAPNHITSLAMHNLIDCETEIDWNWQPVRPRLPIKIY